MSQSVEVNQVGLLDCCLTFQQGAVVSQSVKVNQVGLLDRCLTSQQDVLYLSLLR